MGSVLAFRQPTARACLYDDETMDRIRTTPVANLHGSRLERALRAKAASTQKTYRAAWSRYDEWRIPKGKPVNDDSLSEYLLCLHAEEKAPSTITLVSAAVRFRCKYLGQPNPIGPETEIARTIIRREGTRQRRGKGQAPILHRRDIDKVIETSAAADSLWSVRDAGILSTMFGCGLRSAEVPNIHLEDLDRADTGWNLTIPFSKKDDKPCVLPVPKFCQDRIQAWLDLSGISEGPVFPAIQKNGLNGAAPTVTGRGLHPIHVGRIVRDRGDDAGFKISSHTMRRSFACYLSRRGSSIQDVCIAGRWKDPAMVIRYVQGHDGVSKKIREAFDS